MKRICALFLGLTVAAASLSGCGAQGQETTQQTFPDATAIVLSDDGVTVDGEAASTDETAAVYTAHDIVYYEDGHDFTYGEGTAADAHTAAGANVLIADGTINHVTGSYVARIYDPDSVVLSEDGTEVTDSDKLHKYDGAFYSRMSMNVDGGEAGTGVLNITADNEGLDTELHLTINGGTINITSGNDGINTNEDNVSVTTINGGSVNIQVTGETGEGDGIDSNGYLVINGGAVNAAACSSSGDAGIDASAGITINGGTVLASGNMYDPIDGGDYTLWQGDAQLAGSASDSAGGPGGMGGGRPMDGGEPPADFDPQQAPEDGAQGERPQRPEGEAPENAGGEAPADPPERPADGETAPDGAEPPAGGRGPGGEGGQMMAADLSETFTLADGGNFFTGVSPLETEETSGT